MKKIFFSFKKVACIAIFSFLVFFQKTTAQNGYCNNLGVWMWYIEGTTCKTHGELADSLKKLGVKRIYVKVADGKNFANWPELDDKKVVEAYKSKGIQIWGWTYNYPNNDSLQAQAVIRAAKTGYEGLVVDVEMEFDGDSLGLHRLFKAFDASKKEAIKKGYANSKFELRATTWGNPKAHKFNLKAFDQFVDAHMPQTYVEHWAGKYLTNLESWIDAGTAEYKALGAKKPVYHMIAQEKEPGTVGAMTTAEVNRYIAKAGSETSIFRVPGGGLSTKIWKIWKDVTWKRDFCPPSATGEISVFDNVSIAPNPFAESFSIQLEGLENQEVNVFLSDVQGRIFLQEKSNGSIKVTLNTAILPSGIYFCTLLSEKQGKTIKLVKN